MSNDIEKKLEEVIYVLSEVVSISLTRLSIDLKRKPTDKELFPQEKEALTILANNKPKIMCHWLGSYMREIGYLKDEGKIK